MQPPPVPQPSPQPAADNTFLDLSAGAYSLGLLARAVVVVQQDAVAQETAEFRGEKVPVCDLRHLLGVASAGAIPFLVFVEAGDRIAAVGVDRVGHLRHPEAPKIFRVPSFGLRHPTLIEGALRDGERLLIVLQPRALVDFVFERARRTRDGFDPASTRAV